MTLLRLASCTIQYGKGKDARFDLPRIVADLAEPDIIALQVVEINCARSGMVDQPIIENIEKAVRVIKDRHRTGSLAVDKARWAGGVEPQHRVANDLQTHPANPRVAPS